MPKTNFSGEGFKGAALDVITQAETICAEYAAQGLTLTLRQLYYRFIARDLFPESRRDAVSGTQNTERNYKWLGDLVSRGRVAGMIDWSHITDRTREPDFRDRGWDSPADILAAIAEQYKIPRWTGQPEYVEVWVEKEALAEVIRRTAGRWDVTSFACKGSPSTSSMYEAGMRLRRQERGGRKCSVIYLGDHDPTGIDISRDIADRLALFGSRADVERIALNMDQVLALNPPPSPVKVSDSRTSGYINRFGTDECWELDAIEPADLDTLIEGAILAHLDLDLRQERLGQEERERAQLTAVHENWPDVLAWMLAEDLVREPGEDEPEDGDDQ